MSSSFPSSSLPPRRLCRPRGSSSFYPRNTKGWGTSSRTPRLSSRHVHDCWLSLAPRKRVHDNDFGETTERNDGTVAATASNDSLAAELFYQLTGRRSPKSKTNPWQPCFFTAHAGVPAGTKWGLKENRTDRLFSALPAAAWIRQPRFRDCRSL